MAAMMPGASKSSVRSEGSGEVTIEGFSDSKKVTRTFLLGSDLHSERENRRALRKSPHLPCMGSRPPTHGDVQSGTFRRHVLIIIQANQIMIAGKTTRLHGVIHQKTDIMVFEDRTLRTN
jgi:hypothetical protein